MYEERSRNESWQHLRDQGPLCQKANRGLLRRGSWAQPQKGSSAELMPICARECLPFQLHGSPCPQSTLI